MGRLDLPDKTRDEDTSAPRPEIGSENWVRQEIDAGRSGEERDQ
jgi:hypothetical protein